MRDPQELRPCPRCGTINRVRLQLAEHATCGACRRPMKLNCYDILGVSASATPKEIKSAFRRLTLKWHPDLHPNDGDVARAFRVILRAYETLMNPEARARLDLAMKRDVASFTSSATRMETASSKSEEMAATYAEMIHFTLALSIGVILFVGWVILQVAAAGFADSLFAAAIMCTAYGLFRIIYFLVVGRAITLNFSLRRGQPEKQAGKYAG